MATTSNRVGHPVRNRRRNRNIYNEDEETSFGPSNRISMMYATKSPATTTTSNSTSTTTTASTSSSYSSITSSDSKGKGKQLSSFGITSRGGSNHETSSISSSSSNSNSVTTAASSNNSSGSPSKANRFNKHIGATLTTSLKTLLKLPKAHNWVNHEWFYGNIDQVLFLDENEFSICLRDSFPQLRTRHLTRAEWSQIRRLMGKPRRCSAAFFKEERNTLNTKRQKIRHLQQNKVGSLQAGGFKDLPENIPHPLVVGTNVAALARVCDSLYFGVIEGIDSTNGTYRVAFNRSDVGSLSIPDYEVAPISQPVMAPLASFEQKPRKVWQLANRFVENSEVHAPGGVAGHQHLHSHHHPQASHAHLQSHLLHHADQQHHLPQHHLHPQQRSGAMSAVQSSMQAYRGGGVIGHQLHQQQQLHQLPDPLAVTPIPVPEAIINGFPAKFLVQLVKASRTLSQKRKKVADLKAVNTEIERMTSRSERVSFAFKRSYALSILDLEKINKEVSRHLAAIQSYSLQVASERQLKSLKPDVVSQKCLLESKALVEKLQANKSVRVGCDRTKSLIVNLMSLMFHLRGFRDSEVSCYEFQSIFETIAAIRRQVSHCNVENFQNNVEIHIRHILSSVSHLGNVGVFSESANGGAGGNGGSNGTTSSSLAGGETVNIKMEA